ncbi:MAG: iron-sulfur cluster assembly scaffold protein [Pseudomonadota bacterium]|nr:iron-sulfur cluster assembly scaffold protein [Pseudomonadota bacterium]
MMEALRTRFDTLHWAADARIPARAPYVGHATTPAGDDRVQIWLAVRDGGIETARFRAHGGPAVLCAADWLCEYCEGQALDGLALTPAMVMSALNLSRLQMPAALLAIDALDAARRHAMEHQASGTVSTV